MRGIEAGTGAGGDVRANQKSRPKDDLSWSEVGEMAYGYLRIPLALVFVEIIYWWATEPDASLEPLQVFLAWLWTGVSNLLWPGSAELVFHGPSQSWTGVNLIGSGFYNGEIPLYIDAECAGVHEIMFLGVLMLLTPGVDRRIRNRSLIGMVFIVQFLNFLRLVALYPIGMKYGEAQMNEMHEFIFRQGFLILLVLFWIIWYIQLERNGVRNTKANPALSDIPKLKQIKIRETLPTASIVTLIICALIAIWATHEVTMKDENLHFKTISEECEGAECRTDAAEIWPNAWDRSVRLWLFSGIISGMAILKIEPLSTGDGEE
tara:strand:- start:1782 stop:2741 length:960 start_codon:yes stop_codon:yes gene_type:complete